MPRRKIHIDGPEPLPAPRARHSRKARTPSTSTAEVLPLDAEIHSDRDAAAYAKALMRIRVPVAALLVERRLPLDRILRIAPGTVLKFDRSCAQPLELEVGGRRIAVGEAVTVGEQLGLRITALKQGA